MATTKGSDYFTKKSAEGSAVSELLLDAASVTFLDNLADGLNVGVYTYQSIPLVVNNILTTKVQQLIRNEVIENISHVTAGMATDTNDYVWTWGLNSSGQLGDGGTTSASSPVSVIGGRTFVSITASSDRTHCLGLLDSGQIMSWGLNSSGQLGNGTVTTTSSPVSVSNRTGQAFVTLAANALNSYATDYVGFAWAWGSNTNGALGDNTVTNRSSPVSVLGGRTFVAINGSRAIDFSNYVWAWGDNTSGQVGDNTGTNRSSPVSMVGGISNFIAIASATSHALMLTDRGDIYATGANNFGQLGDNTVTNRSSPVSVTASGRKFVAIATGPTHSLALDRQGFLWSWGKNTVGQVGDNTTANRSVPTSVITNRRFVLIGTDNDTNTVIDTDGISWSWGNNTDGGLGNLATGDRSKPGVIENTGHIWRTRKVY